MQQTVADKPITVIKPVLMGWVLLLRYLPLQLNLTFVGGGVGGGLGFLLMLFFNLPYSVYAPFIVFASLFFIGTPVVIYTIGQRTYAKTDYRFYRDRLEYTEGFWTIEHKVIQYRNITEVMLRRNIMQRICGLGSVYLMVPAWGARSGISITDVRHAEKVYQKVQQIIQQVGS